MIFINRISDILIKYTDMPEDFAVCTAYHAISETLGQFFIQPNLKMRPNLYTLLCSTPQISRRGTVMDALEKVVFTALETYGDNLDVDDPITKTVKKKNDEGEIEEVEKIIPRRKLFKTVHSLSGGSGAGFTDKIERMYNEYAIKHFGVHSREFGHQMTQMLEKGSFSSTLMELYVLLYRGESKTDDFSEKGEGKTERTLPPVYFTLFGTMQRPDTYIKSAVVSYTGFLRRFILNSKSGRIIIKKFIPGLDLNLRGMEAELVEIGKKIGMMMFACSTKGKLIDMSYTKDFYNKYTPLEKSVREYCGLNEESPYAQFKVGMVEQILKYSMLYAIAESRTELTENDFDSSRELVEKLTQELKETVEDTALTNDQKRQKKDYTQVLNAISTAKNSTELQRKCTYSNSKQINQHIREALSRGEISVEQALQFLTEKMVVMSLFRDEMITRDDVELWVERHKKGRKPK